MKNNFFRIITDKKNINKNFKIIKKIKIKMTKTPIQQTPSLIRN